MDSKIFHGEVFESDDRKSLFFSRQELVRFSFFAIKYPETSCCHFWSEFPNFPTQSCWKKLCSAFGLVSFAWKKSRIWIGFSTFAAKKKPVRPPTCDCKERKSHVERRRFLDPGDPLFLLPSKVLRNCRPTIFLAAKSNFIHVRDLSKTRSFFFTFLTDFGAIFA